MRNRKKRNYYRNLLAAVIFCLLLLSSCRKSAPSSEPGLLDFGNQNDEAIRLVAEANEKLRGVKKLYKENQEKIEDLKNAMNNKDVATVKKLSDDFVYQINDGMALGEEAIKKIEEASEKNINPKFQEYLHLKEQSLRKQLEAFEFRRQLARQLRDAFAISKDANLIEKAKNELQNKEDNFQQYMESARELSRQANDLAKAK